MTVVILVILLIGALGYITYDKYYIDSSNKEKLEQVSEKFEDANKKLEDANEELEQKTNDLKKAKKELNKNMKSEEEAYIVFNPYPEYEEDVNVYAIGSSNIVFSYKGELYLTEYNFNGVFNSTLNVKDKNFRNDKVTVMNDVKKSDIYKLNVNESDINKVKIYHNVTFKDPTYNIYLIYEDGSTKVITVGSSLGKARTILKDYKVVDLKEKCGHINEASDNCDKASYELTLQDGTTKKVTE